MLLRLLLVWLINTLALLAVSYLMPSVQVTSFGAALAAAAVLGLVNAFVRPIVSLLSLPITCITLGLFAIVVNAGMLMLTSWISSYTPVEFHVDTFFWDAIFGTIIISIVSAVMGWLLPGPE